MMKEKFITASANVYSLDPRLNANEIIIEKKEDVLFDTILSNSFGFGGTNATLAISNWFGS